MSTTFKWTVGNLKCMPQAEGQVNVVTEVHWSCVGEKEHDGKTYSAGVYNVCQVNYKGGDFTPFADLTQDEVIGWVWASGVDKDAAEESINQRIALDINPPIISPPLPWSAQ